MNIIIVDDEPLARENIECILFEKFPDLHIMGYAESVDSAINVIESKKPDLVFLDVDIVGGSGFDVLTALKPVNFKVIFVTAYKQYAIQAIKFSAFDFILKPIDKLELFSAVERALALTKENSDVSWDVFFGNMNATSEKLKRIVLKTSDSIHLVNIGDIVRCEADNNYSTFYLVNNDKIVISKGLKEYEEMLSDYGFYRVHQSHLVNLNFVIRFDKKNGGSLVLSNKHSVPVSQRKKQNLLKFFEQII